MGPHDLVAGYYTISGSRAGEGEGEAARASFEVWTGSGTAATGEGSHAAVAGWAFTIVKGDSVTFEAGPDGLRLFVVTLDA